MARVLKGSHSFTCTPRVHPLTGWTIPAFAFPAEAGTHLPTPEGWKAELALENHVRKAHRVWSNPDAAGEIIAIFRSPIFCNNYYLEPSWLCPSFALKSTHIHADWTSEQTPRRLFYVFLTVTMFSFYGSAANERDRGVMFSSCSYDCLSIRPSVNTYFAWRVIS